MSIDYLLRIPRETEDKYISDFYYNTSTRGEIVTFICTGFPNLLTIDNYEDWLNAFFQHYKQQTGEENPKFKSEYIMEDYDATITGNIPIKMTVSTAGYYLRFSYSRKKTKEARKLVDTFIDIIWYGTGKTKTQGDAALLPTVDPHLTGI